MTAPTNISVTNPLADYSRRKFLASTMGSALALAAGDLLAAKTARLQIAAARTASRLIFINLVGGPSQIDTWDPKPDADSSIRNFDPACATSVPGIFISENLPRLSRRMHLVSLVRSLHYAGPATHEAGQQLLMTGNCFFHNRPAPYLGSVFARLLGDQSSAPAPELLGGRLSPDTAGEIDIQTCEASASMIHSLAPTSDERFGHSGLGRSCLQAIRLIERGTRVVMINHFTSVYDQPTWDMHANGGRLNSTPADYRQLLCPQLDLALSGLLDDLAECGLLSETVVAVAGEMGRSPRINRYGGRDHHTGVWSALLAGGPIPRGQVIGQSDACGEYPVSSPMTPAALWSMIGDAVGVKSSVM